MSGSSCCDRAILLPFSVCQHVAVVSLEKGCAVAHRLVKDDLTGRELQAGLVACLTVGTDCGDARVASAQVVSADADAGETVNCPESRVRHFYTEIPAALVGDAAVNSARRVCGEFSRPTNKSHCVTELWIKQIIRNGIILFHGF